VTDSQSFSSAGSLGHLRNKDDDLHEILNYRRDSLNCSPDKALVSPLALGFNDRFVLPIGSENYFTLLVPWILAKSGKSYSLTAIG